MKKLNEIAVCVWGDNDIESNEKDFVNNFFNKELGKTPLVFQSSDNNIFKSFWLVNHLKRQYELNKLSLFDIVIYMNKNYISEIKNLRYNYPIESNALYCLNAENGINPFLFYSTSTSGDYASNYIWNKRENIELNSDFYNHIKSYKLRVFLSNKINESSSLF